MRTHLSIKVLVIALCVAADSVFAASGLEIPKGCWGEQFRWSFADPACQAALKAHQPAMAALNIGYDNDGLWDWGDPKREGPEVLGKMVDQYADAGAKFIVWGCGSDKAWGYTPKAQELWGAKMSKETVGKYPGWGKSAARVESFLAAGADPLSILLKRAKARKLPVLAGFRDANRYSNHFPNSWFIANPRFHLSPKRNAWPKAEFGVNFALPEVREHKVRQWIDVVERYDVDGLHLEFMRSLPFFEKDEPDKIKHMNTLMRMLRKELDRIGQQRGKRLKLAIWLPTPYHMQILRPMFPPDFFDMAAQGLDPETWIKEGLVDVLMPSIYATDLDMPKPGDMPPWVKTAKGSSTKVYACVMNIVRTTRSGKKYAATAARTAEIMRRLSSEYDGIFLFNSQPYSLAAVLDAAAAKRARVEAARRQRRIIFNDDAEGLLKHTGTGTVDGFLERRLKPLAGTNVGAISWAAVTFGDAPVYDSKVQPIWGDAHGAPPDGYRNAKNFKALIEAGHCPLQVVVDFAHQNGMEAFAHVRMNDVHDSFMNGMKTIWKRQHPELLVDSTGIPPSIDAHPMGLYVSAQDFSHKEVRRRKFEIIEEIAQRYDIDGFELDYIRHAVLFSRTMRGLPVTKEEVEIITSLHRRIRKLTDEVGARRGRPVLLAVRVPDSFELAMNIGLDVKTWLKEDLVDILIAGGGYTPFTTPVAEFTKVAHQYDVPVYPCANLGAVEQVSDGAYLECMRALAANWYRAGADGMYPWNMCTFDLGKYGQDMIASRERGYACLADIGDPKALAGKDKLYCVDEGVYMPYRFISSTPPLPLKLKQGQPQQIPLVIGDDVEAATKSGLLAELKLTMTFAGAMRKEALLVRLNGKTLADGEALEGGKLSMYAPAEKDTQIWRMNYLLSAPPLKMGRNIIEVSLNGDESAPAESLELFRVRLRVKYQ